MCSNSTVGKLEESVELKFAIKATKQTDKNRCDVTDVKVSLNFHAIFQILFFPLRILENVMIGFPHV